MLLEKSHIKDRRGSYERMGTIDYSYGNTLR